MNKPDIFSQSGFSREQFLREYWQKKPLVLRRAVRQSDLAFLPGKTDLLKLAENEAVQSRIVLTETSPEGTPCYHVEYGPFEPEDWPNLPDTPWTILVSDVEKWLPSHRRLLDYFPFIRRWQFDDLMFSYASEGGSVGAHTDHYDVFLLQVSGRRQWHFNQQPDPEAAWLPDTELKLLQHFNPDHSVILEAGDLLYLPAEVAHHGLSLDNECVTCSVGLRAPAESELLSGYFEDRAASLPDEARFSPPVEPTQFTPAGEITPADVARLRQTLEQHLSLDNARLANWFGRFITGYRNLFYEIQASEASAETDSQSFSAALNGETGLIPDPFARLAWRKLAKEAGGKPGIDPDTDEAELYVNGQAHRCSTAMAAALADQQRLEPGQITALTDSDRAVARRLLESGEIRPK